MYMRGRTVRFAVMTVAVVLALTGFSTGHRHRHSSGGGCSSSRQDHDGSTSSHSSSSSRAGGGGYRARPTHRASPTPSSAKPSSPPKDGVAKLVRCGDLEGDPDTVIEVRNPNPREADFFVKVQWKDSAGNTAGESGRTITVPAKGVGTARISAASSGVADRYDHCHVEPRVDGIW